MPRAGTTHRIKFWLIRDGDGITNQHIYLRIMKDSDGTFLNVDGSAFQEVAEEVLMTEASRSGMPGYYYYDFDQATSDSSVTENYTLRFRTNSTQYAIDDERFSELEFTAGGGNETFDPGEDFGGVMQRMKYDRAGRGYRPMFMGAFGLDRATRTRKVINNRSKSSNPVETSNAQSQPGGGNPYS